MPTLVSGIDLLNELGFYKVIAPMLLIAIATYAILQKKEIFGGHKGIDATLGVIIGLVVIRSVQTVEFLSTFIQYMTVVAAVLLFLVMIFLFTGVEEKSIGEVMTESPLAWGTIITVLVIVLFIVSSQTLPQIGAATEGDLAGTSVTDKALKTLFHPTILSIVVLFAVFVVTVYVITRTPE